MLLSCYSTDKLEAGCDEAGRGCLAGPVYAAAVILPGGFSHPTLNDSKKLSKKNRLMLREIILNEALAYAVASVDNHIIDEINILNASLLAMHKALNALEITPELLLIDGNRFKPYKQIPHLCIIRGDGIYASIAAASILAKTYRDEFMENLSQDFPMYAWSDNKGYAAKKHIKAISEYGLTIHHRRSFHLKSQLRLDL